MDRKVLSHQAVDRALRILICTDCHEEFVFTAEAQAYFAEKGYVDDLKRCKSCHAAHKQAERCHVPSRPSA
ncbi:MAG: zinc-ribbon domain containing protein [bacterium]|nr:zinc-ribbon domain containing protein [bacterium]